MVYGYPKTPLLRTDGERGFFVAGGKVHNDGRYEVRRGNNNNWLTTSRRPRGNKTL